MGTKNLATMGLRRWASDAVALVVLMGALAALTSHMRSEMDVSPDDGLLMLSTTSDAASSAAPKRNSLLHWHIHWPHIHFHWPWHHHIHLKTLLSKIAHSFEKDVKKVEHWVESIPQKMDGALVKLEGDFKSLAKDARKVLKSIGTFVKNFQPWLVKLNTKIFGKRLGPILEKLEMAGIESIPGVGTAVKILVDGVDVYNDVKGIDTCLKSKDYDCVGKDLLNVLTTVDGIMVNNFNGMKSVITGLNDAIKVVKGGLEVEEAVEKDFPLLKNAFDLLEKKPLKAQDAIKAVYDLSEVTADVGSAILGADSGVVSKWKVASKRLKELVAVSKDVQAIYVAGTDIYPELKKAKSCFKDRKFVCVGKEGAAILNQVDSVIMDHFAAVSGGAKDLAKVASGVTIAVDTEQTYEQFKAAFEEFSESPLTVGAVEQGLAELSSAAGSLSNEIESANQLVGGRLKDFSKYASSELIRVSKVSDEVDKVLVAGVDIKSKLLNAKTCWHEKNYACVASDLSAISQDVSTAAGQWKDVSKFARAMARVADVTEVSSDVVAEYGNLRAFAKDMSTRPFTADVAQRALGSLATALNGMSTVLHGLDSLMPNIASVTEQIQKDINKALVVDNDISSTISCGVRVGQDLKTIESAWATKDWAKIGSTVRDIISAIETELKLFKNMQSVTKVLADVNEAVDLSMNIMVTYDDFNAALDDLKGAKSEDKVVGGLKKLSAALNDMKTDLEDWQALAGNRASALVAKLEKDLDIAVTDTGVITKAVVDGYDFASELQQLMNDAKTSPRDWSQIGKDLKALAQLFQGSN